MSYQPAASQPTISHDAEYAERSWQALNLFWLIIGIFPIIMLVRLILECARRLCSLHPPSPPVSGPTFEAANAPAPVPCGLDAAVINGLPIELYVNSARASADESECCICLGLFADGDKVKVLPMCRHRFHCVCVDRWLRTQSNCPLCRGSI